MTAAVTAAAVARPAERPFAGIGRLMLLSLRRDRVMLAIWALIMSLLPAFTVLAARATLADQAAIDRFVTGSMASPSQLATRGPIFDASIGGIGAWTAASSGGLLMGLVAIMITIRYTRGDEQAGRQELLRSRTVGRLAPLASGVAVPLLVCALIAVLATATLLALGLPLAGSVVLGLVLAGSGAVFAGVGSVAAQLTEGAAAARTIGLVVLGASFAVAATGDVASSPVVWASPIGWTRHAEAYAGNHGWVVPLQLATTAALLTIASALAARRDLSGGLIPSRRGRSYAAPWLAGTVSLAWRRHRGQAFGWAIGLGLLGLLLGSVTSGLSEQLETDAFADLSALMGGASVGEVFFQFIVYVLAQITTAAGMVAILTARLDESGGLAEMVLVRPVRRTRWLLGQLVVAVLVSAAALTALGLGGGLASGDPVGVLLLAWSYLPAALSLIGLAAALIGWLPRQAVAASWTVLGLIVFADLLAEFGLVPLELMRLISPYAATFERVLAGESPWPVVTTLLLIAVGLTALGLVGLRRRDLDT